MEQQSVIPTDTCVTCENFIGGGDWGLCCKIKYDLCYECNGMGMTVRKFVELAESLGYQVLLSNGETGDEYLFDGESDEY